MSSTDESWPIPERRKQIEARAKSEGLDLPSYSLITANRNPVFDCDLVWIQHRDEVLQISVDEEMPPQPIEVLSDDSSDFLTDQERVLNAYRIRCPSLHALDDAQIIELVTAFISGTRDALHAKLRSLDPNFEFLDYTTLQT